MKKSSLNSAILCWMATAGCILIVGNGFGCASASKHGPAVTTVGSKRDGIQELNLLAIPVALNLDDKPGLDGFVIKVYANNRTRPKSLVVEQGTIEVMMFDGVLGVTSESSGGPLRVWKYSAQELKRFLIESSIGPCYQLAPLWGDAVPASKQISVLVRYTAPNGNVITSAPSIISIALK